jgi:hypothetical protein
VIIVTLISEKHNEWEVSKGVFLLTFTILSAMSVLSLFTGFGIDFLPFKLCPMIFMTAGILILQGVLQKRETDH